MSKAKTKAKAQADEQAWPASKVELWPLARIKPYPENPRTHTPQQIELIAASMRDDGVTAPILVDEAGTIIYGHGRLQAAQQNGYKNYPVLVARGWSDKRKRGYRIKDNSLALLAGWDAELMHQEVTDLRLADYDLGLLGFPEAELASYTLLDGNQSAVDPEVTPAPVKNPVVRPGDLWQLGEHKLLCGDATQKASWDRLLKPADRAAMVFTDPPYGVSYESTSGKYGVIDGDDKRRDELYKMLLASLKQMASRATDHAAFYIWHASSTREDFAEAMTAAGLIERQYLIWVKPGIVLGHSDYRWQHEPCFYASKTSSKPAFYGDRSDSTVWRASIGGIHKDVAATVGNGVLLLDGQGGTLYVQSRAPKAKKLRQLRIAKGKSAFLLGSDRRDGTVWEVARDGGHVHPTQKPVELARRAIENSSKPGEIVADGFLGSGTTIIGAEMTARRCVGCELDPVYAQVAIERWQAFTGKTAIHTYSGKTLEEIRPAAKKARKSRQNQAEIAAE